METFLTAEERAYIGCIAGGSIFNEFFHNDSSKAVGLLRKLRDLFPDVTLIVGDYYGTLIPEGTTQPSPDAIPEEVTGYKAVLLHDGACPFIASIPNP